jgi:hypothetical protein
MDRIRLSGSDDLLLDTLVDVWIQFLRRDSVESRQLEQVNDAWHRRTLLPAGDAVDAIEPEPRSNLGLEQTDAFTVGLEVVYEWF